MSNLKEELDKLLETPNEDEIRFARLTRIAQDALREAARQAAERKAKKHQA